MQLTAAYPLPIASNFCVEFLWLDRLLITRIAMLQGHEKGVNCIDYYEGGDRPYLISGADDKTCKIWDYQTKACVQTLEGHTHNVSCVGFSPNLPLIITGSEDGTVRLWHSTTYRLENTLNYNMERVWAVASLKGESPRLPGTPPHVL